MTPFGRASIGKRRFRRSPPQLFEAGRIGGGVSDGVLNVPMPEVILNTFGAKPTITIAGSAVCAACRETCAAVFPQDLY
jgi:hypothetical protein